MKHRTIKKRRAIIGKTQDQVAKALANLRMTGKQIERAFKKHSQAIRHRAG
jgi:DNA-binding XRE family transcriptional regulator